MKEDEKKNKENFEGSYFTNVLADLVCGVPNVGAFAM